MEKERLKKEIIQKIMECEDPEVLQRVEEVLSHFSYKASEAGEEYIQKASISEELSISPEQEEELMRRYRDYLGGKSKGFTWEEVRQELKDLYGF